MPNIFSRNLVRLTFDPAHDHRILFPKEMDCALFHQSGLGKSGCDKPGHGKPGYGRSGRGKPGHGKPGYCKPGRDADRVALDTKVDDIKHKPPDEIKNASEGAERKFKNDITSLVF